MSKSQKLDHFTELSKLSPCSMSVYLAKYLCLTGEFFYWYLPFKVGKQCSKAGRRDFHGNLPQRGLSTTNTDTVKRLWGDFNLPKSQPSPCPLTHSLRKKKCRKWSQKGHLKNVAPTVDYWQPISWPFPLIHLNIWKGGLRERVH